MKRVKNLGDGQAGPSSKGRRKDTTLEASAAGDPCGEVLFWYCRVCDLSSTTGDPLAHALLHSKAQQGNLLMNGPWLVGGRDRVEF